MYFANPQKLNFPNKEFSQFLKKSENTLLRLDETSVYCVTLKK